jgi:hypothetical protein
LYVSYLIQQRRIAAEVYVIVLAVILEGRWSLKRNETGAWKYILVDPLVKEL